MGCRNTVFNASAQSGAEYVGELVSAGVKHFRVELVGRCRFTVSNPVLKVPTISALGTGIS
jgi:putative protease